MWGPVPSVVTGQQRQFLMLGGPGQAVLRTDCIQLPRVLSDASCVWVL